MRRLLAVMVLFMLTVTVPTLAQQSKKKGGSGDSGPNGLTLSENETYRFKEYDALFSSPDGSPTLVGGTYIARTKLEDAAGKEDVNLYCDFVMSTQPACPVGNVDMEISIGKDVLWTGTSTFFHGFQNRCYASVYADPMDLDGYGKGQQLQCKITVEDPNFEISGNDFAAAIPTWEVSYPGR